MKTKPIITIILLFNFLTSNGHEGSQKPNELDKRDTVQTLVSSPQHSVSSKARSYSSEYSNLPTLEKAKTNHTIQISEQENLSAQDSRSETTNLATWKPISREEIANLSQAGALSFSILTLVASGFLVIYQQTRIQKNKLLFQTMVELSQRQQALLEEQLKMARIREQELLCELEYKTKSLTTYALSMVQKNEMLKEVQESVGSFLEKPDRPSEQLKKLTRAIEFELTLDKDWDDFKLYFQEVQTDFFPRLKERFPDLSSADLKLCALVKLNLSMKQTAAVLRISPDSVKVARHRLKKKFNLQTVDNLSTFVMSLCN